MLRRVSDLSGATHDDTRLEGNGAQKTIGSASPPMVVEVPSPKSTSSKAEILSPTSMQMASWRRLSARPPAKPQRAFLQALQEWEGYVTHIDQDYFSARLIDITAGSAVEEEAVELLTCDLRDADRALLKEGALFRWVIGYLRGENGSKERVSRIVFRRLPAWTKHDLLSAKSRAAEIGEKLTWSE